MKKTSKRRGNNLQNLVQNRPTKRPKPTGPIRHLDPAWRVNPSFESAEKDPIPELPPPEKHEPVYFPISTKGVSFADQKLLYCGDDQEELDASPENWQRYRILVKKGDALVVELWRGIWLLHDWDETKLVPSASKFCHVSVHNEQVSCDCSAAKKRLTAAKKGSLSAGDQRRLCTHCDLFLHCNDMFPSTTNSTQLQPVVSFALSGISIFPLFFSIQQSGSSAIGYHNSGKRVVTMYLGNDRWRCSCQTHNTCEHMHKAVAFSFENDLATRSDDGAFVLSDKIPIIEVDSDEQKELYLSASSFRQETISHKTISSPFHFHRETDPVPSQRPAYIETQHGTLVLDMCALSKQREVAAYSAVDNKEHTIGDDAYA
ncbi:hypothetical protein L198_05726 [Cryptococcus wingfieldii CBS 7118]|uniref:SWIM-type domain-containing protein n=1 Tax=Cryptococcus wingfieldii CBS 7118 TaxID=1295528 RepID=A0A1E3ITW7_9TREE|nr:hypothetical protein L198_05726 [Cryptococcus wingfieldii CBS 7118]ODN92054.1 hypothetical protein L198_05726 [Cryptococcus wingfieldii CBS 7118]